MESILLPEDEDALVLDELRAFAELIDCADFESLRIFVENVRHERANECIGLTTNREQRRAESVEDRRTRASFSFLHGSRGPAFDRERAPRTPCPPRAGPP